MESTKQYLFVYGSLLDEGNPYGAYLQRHATPFMPGKIKGKLYDIGEYPGAISLPEDKTYVYGVIFSLDITEVILNVLDEYEGFGDAFEQPNEFVRELIDVEVDTGTVPCWVYLYNFSVSHLPEITGGQYL